MDWYFAESNQQFGPVPPEQFQRLVSEGRIRAHTLVWADGMANWLPYQQVYAQQVAQQDSALGADPAPGAALDPATGQVAQAVAPAWGFCCQCGRMYQTEDMIAYENHWVCAECKPLFFQRIREGVPPDAAAMGLRQAIVRYGGFWIRFVAVFLDGLILVVPKLALTFGLMAILASDQIGRGPDLSRLLNPFVGGWLFVVGLIGELIPVAYNTLMNGQYGATLGKMALGLRVVMANGDRISYGRALARAAVKLGLGLLPLGLGLIGYIIAGFDSEKRALHDHICKTRVIHK